MPMSSHVPSAAGSSAVASGTTTGAANSQRITVHATDMLRFQPSTIDARVGTVRIELIDDGSYPHNLAVPALHAKSTDVSGSLGQKTASITVHLTRPGTYSFECTYHSSAGMVGHLVVRG